MDFNKKGSGPAKNVGIFNETNWLLLEIDSKGIKASEEKVKAILKLKQQKNWNSFLGRFNTWHIFYQNFRKERTDSKNW